MSSKPAKDGSPESLEYLAERLAWYDYHGLSAYAQAGAEKLSKYRDALQYANNPPELNMSNYSDDDVAELNYWAIELATLVRKVLP